MAYSLTITGDAPLQARLQKILAVLENPTDLWEAIGFAMKENTRLRITEQVDVDGQAFVPSYRAQEQGGQTLLDRGLLRNSITYFANKNGVEWGVPSEFPYAWILNEGGTIVPKTKPFLRFKIGGKFVSRRKVTIPKRQFLGFSTSDKQEVLDIIESFIKG
jgi:phage gpG-like protein